MKTDFFSLSKIHNELVVPACEPYTLQMKDQSVMRYYNQHDLIGKAERWSSSKIFDGFIGWTS